MEREVGTRQLNYKKNKKHGQSSIRIVKLNKVIL